MFNHYRPGLFLSLISSMLLVSCGTYQAKGKPILPQQGPTMAEIYRNHDQQMHLTSDIQPEFQVIVSDDALYTTYAHDVINKIDSIFPVLPNPTLLMYVYPHLAGDDMAPVPGYHTSFPLYERTYYAMPGEVLPK